MKTDQEASTIEQLQREIASLRQQNEVYRHQAAFPQLNPVPIFEFDRYGQVVYLNHAAQQTLNQLAPIDARIFLPDRLEESINREQDNVLQSFTELQINDQIFEETIAHSKEYDTVRIYANNITQHRLAEQALNVKKLELIQTQEFLEAVTKGTDVIIASIDLNFCYTYFNQAYQEELKRLSGKDIERGMNILDVFSHLPDQQKIIAREWGLVLQGESTN